MTVIAARVAPRRARVAPGGRICGVRGVGLEEPGSRRITHRAWAASVLVALSSLAVPALLAAPARDPLKLPKKSVMVTTTIEAAPGLSATLAEYFTGEKSEKTGIDLLLGLHRLEGEARTLVASRDY